MSGFAGYGSRLPGRRKALCRHPQVVQEAGEMRALQVRALEGPDGLELAEVPEPGGQHPLVPGDSVVIDVHAAGVSFADLLVIRGQYQLRQEPPFVPGFEVAGTVRAAPADSPFREGDRVAACTIVGGFAEIAVAPAHATFPLSDRLDFVSGAALVLNHHTAYFALRLRGRLGEGETVLVRGAAGGVGSAALQVARALGARPIAVVSSAEKERVAHEAGADAVLRTDGPWHEQARELTGGRGVDIVLDPVGGERFTDALRALALGGRVVVVGFTGGTIPEVKVNRLLLRNTEVVGAAWTEYVRERPAVADEIGAAVNRMVDDGDVRPVVGARFPLARGAEALRLVEARGVLGKAVIEVRTT
jgi:NADPH2:quinone reductase